MIKLGLPENLTQNLQIERALRTDDLKRYFEGDRDVPRLDFMSRPEDCHAESNRFDRLYGFEQAKIINDKILFRKAVRAASLVLGEEAKGANEIKNGVVAKLMGRNLLQIADVVAFPLGPVAMIHKPVRINDLDPATLAKLEAMATKRGPNSGLIRDDFGGGLVSTPENPETAQKLIEETTGRPALQIKS